MPQLRKDPIVGRWVIIAAERAQRPTQFEGHGNTTRRDPCPFCANNEELTPPEIAAYRPNGSSRDQPGWTLRVVPNQYPALVTEGEFCLQVNGMYESVNGYGAHEVIIETPRHETHMASLSDREFEHVVAVYRERILELKKDPRFRYILIFKNQGREAGATIEHTHSQLIALPIVPLTVRDELQGATTHYRTHNRCIYCDVLLQETAAKARIVSENDSFLVICPFASRFPAETWILPKRHAAHFEYGLTHEYADLASALKSTLLGLHRALSQPAFNYIVHTMPFGEPENGHYHWHVEIIPKLTQVAGFEWGTGFYINPMPPEEAALLLRENQL